MPEEDLMAKRGRKKDNTLAPSIFIRLFVGDTERLNAWIASQRIKPTISAVIRVAVSEFLDREGF
jgi:hypothetical protein